MNSIFTRITRLAPAAVFFVAMAAGAAEPEPRLSLPQTPVGTPHDFDFEHGRWRTTVRRLLHPLSGSQEWTEYVGTSVVHALLGGKANLVELDVAGAQGKIQGLSLRLYDTQQQRWTLNYSNTAAGTLELPMSGGFAGGKRGVFYSNETFKGRPVIVRFVVTVEDPDTARFEQAFSADAGATWEVNWIAVDKRI
jgi:hypothetical protein